MNSVPSAMVFAAYDWDEPGEYVPFIRALNESEQFTEDLSEIDAIDYGYVCVARYGDVEFAFMPSSLIRFIQWAVHNFNSLCRPCYIFFGAREEHIIFTCSRAQLMMQAMALTGSTEDWKPLFGRPLQYAHSYELLEPNRDGEGRPQWPGTVTRSITINTRDWLEGIIGIGEHFRQLMLQSRPLIDQNPKNYIDPDVADRIREAYEFCEEYPAIRPEIERTMMDL